MGSRGIISDKWSMRILWGCAIGSAIGMIDRFRHLILEIGFVFSLITSFCFSKSMSFSFSERQFLKPYDCLGLYMVAVERQTQNRARALAEGLRAAESQGDGDSV